MLLLCLLQEQQDPHIARGHARFALFLAQVRHLPVEDAAQAFEVEEVSAPRSRGGKGCVAQSVVLRVPVIPADMIIPWSFACICARSPSPLHCAKARSA